MQGGWIPVVLQCNIDHLGVYTVIKIVASWVVTNASMLHSPSFFHALYIPPICKATNSRISGLKPSFRLHPCTFQNRNNNTLQ